MKTVNFLPPASTCVASSSTQSAVLIDDISPCISVVVNLSPLALAFCRQIVESSTAHDCPEKLELSEVLSKATLGKIKYLRYQVIMPIACARLLAKISDEFRSSEHKQSLTAINRSVLTELLKVLGSKRELSVDKLLKPSEVRLRS